VKSRTHHAAGTNWTLEGETINVFIPMTWKKRRSGQKVIIAPDGSDAWTPTKARPDETLICALARAHRWNRMLQQGRCRSIAEIAEAEKIDRAYVSRLLDLTLLAPDIQEAILEGRGSRKGCSWRSWQRRCRGDEAYFTSQSMINTMLPTARNGVALYCANISTSLA
jgi:hypothetical protein